MDIDIIVDSDREIYAQWGLGVSSAWYVLSPFTLCGSWERQMLYGIDQLRVVVDVRHLEALLLLQREW
jgi:hypothetical protein